MAKKSQLGLGFLVAFVLIAVVAALILFAGLGSTRDMDIVRGPRVGLVELEGPIFSSRPVVRQFKKFEKEDNVKAIVFRINSPGGGIAASQEIYQYAKRVRETGKPVIVSMASAAASGGYYVALGADTIMANPGTTTGSIGVIAEIPNFQGLMEKIGVSMTIIKSGEFKDAGSPYRGLSPRDMQYLQNWIDNGYEQFIQTVALERGMDLQSIRNLADGRVYSGEQAKNLGLIDSLGTLEDAIQLAAELGGITGEPKVVRIRQDRLTLFDLMTSDIRKLLRSSFATWPRIRYMMSF